ncbi:sensor histidine kinase [Rhizobium leguminosarum]|uniref:sensor histidine kinase n=1 Tax=Rhizobium leguminosarum TaxID=384 RepID=UPI001AE867B7|nr:ATP-binding protein [Rhizobium leguminosarum]
MPAVDHRQTTHLSVCTFRRTNDVIDLRPGTSTGIAGTGIGLNLVKQIVELHHGSIEVRSTRGCGSTFIVTLPIKRTDNASASSDAA